MAIPKMSAALQCAPGVELEQWAWADCYTGTADALIAAGIITAAQVPGSPGLGKTGATFYDGQPVRKGGRAPKDERWQRVSRIGRIYEVTCGISSSEAERRQAERQRKEETKQKEQRAALDADPDRFRLIMRLCVQTLSRFLRDHTPGEHQRGKPDFPCRLNPEGFGEILKAMQTIEEWIEAAQVVAPSTGGQKFSAARRDQAFQSFLQSQCLGGA